MGGSDFVSRDVVAQLGILGGGVRVPGQIFARQLPPDPLGIFCEEEDASLQPNFLRAFFDLSFEERTDHWIPRSSGCRPEIIFQILVLLYRRTLLRNVLILPSYTDLCIFLPGPARGHFFHNQKVLAFRKFLGIFLAAKLSRWFL
jgi:hypothetical protein